MMQATEIARLVKTTVKHSKVLHFVNGVSDSKPIVPVAEPKLIKLASDWRPFAN